MSARTSCSPPPTRPTGPPNETREKIVPLAHQIERRRDDQRAAALVVDGHASPRGSCRRRWAARRRLDLALVAKPRSPRTGRAAAAMHASSLGELRVAARLVFVRDLGDERARAPRRRRPPRVPASSGFVDPIGRCRRARRERDHRRQRPIRGPRWFPQRTRGRSRRHPNLRSHIYSMIKNG